MGIKNRKRRRLAVTRQGMDEVTAGARFGLLKKATSLSNGLSHDMTVLAEVFAHVAPTRKLLIADAESRCSETKLEGMMAQNQACVEDESWRRRRPNR